jgi:hypothetical protein
MGSPSEGDSMYPGNQSILQTRLETFPNILAILAYNYSRLIKKQELKNSKMFPFVSRR